MCLYSSQDIIVACFMLPCVSPREVNTSTNALALMLEMQGGVRGGVTDGNAGVEII